MEIKRKVIPGFKRFSKRELIVFAMLISEYKAVEIATALGLDQKTVATYKLRLLTKTNSKTTVGLYKFNQEHKLLDETLLGNITWTCQNIM